MGITKKYEFKRFGLNLKFALLDDKYIRLYSLGDIESDCPEEALLAYYRPVEIQVSGLNQNGHHGIKNIDTYFGQNSTFVGFEEKEIEEGYEVILVTSDEYLECKTHYVLHKTSKTISTWNEVLNTSGQSLLLEHVSSFFQVGFASNSNRELYFHQAYNSWHCEAQWASDSFAHLGMYNGNHNLCFKKIELSSTGSFSTKEHLPLCGIEDRNAKTFRLIQIEPLSSWHLEIGDNCDLLYLSASSGSLDSNNWTKRVKAGETYRGIRSSCSFGKDFEEALGELTKYRRVIRLDRPDLHQMPVIYNDYMHALWDKQTEELVLPLVDVAADHGCELFVMDAGWFAEGSTWWDILGDWRECPANWPHGLKYVFDYIASKGMKKGLWIEIEAVGKDCPLLKQMKEDWFFSYHGVRRMHHSRYQLNFANPEVYDYALKTVSSIIKKYGLDYLKIDYNTDSGVGNDLNYDSPSEGLEEHTRAVLMWLRELSSLFPGLTIENCASGGNRMDYSFLSICPIQSTSDQTDYRLYPYLSGNVLTAATPEQAAVWAYPVDTLHKDIVRSKESTALNMINAMLGRVHLASDLSLLTPEEQSLVKEGVAFFKETRTWKGKALSIYPYGLPHWGDDYVVAGIKDETHILLNVSLLNKDKLSLDIDLRPYGVKEIALGYPLSLPTLYRFEGGILHVELEGPYVGRSFLGVIE